MKLEQIVAKWYNLPGMVGLAPNLTQFGAKPTILAIRGVIEISLSIHFGSALTS